MSVQTFGSVVDSTRSYSFHSNYPMTFDIRIDSTRNSFSGRSLSYTILKFTSGVRLIEEAEVRFEQSPYIVNPLLAIKIYKDPTDNKWCLKVTGMNDNVYSSTYDWIIRMRFFPNSWNLTYVSTTYASNDEV